MSVLQTDSAASVLEVTHLCKAFNIYDKPIDRLKESLFGTNHHRHFLAVDDVSFTVAPGEAIGVIGRNGAGKSTLLKLISRVMLPDSGDIRCRGTLTGLLELGTGFDATMTGRQNIQINGRLLGLRSDEIDARMAQIVHFSELGAFIDAPVRTYSSGMVMRLGFSVAIHADPACFVVDEALAVGDARFQQKCMKKIREHREGGGAILFVSHDMNAVKLICDRALLIERGKILCDATPDEAARNYLKIIAGSNALDDAYAQVESTTQFGARRVEITAVQLLDQRDAVVTMVRSGQRIRIRVQSRSTIDTRMNVGFLIRDRFGQDIFGTNTALLQREVTFAAGSNMTHDFDMDLHLAPGKYAITVAIHSDDTHVHDCQHWWESALSFEIVGFADGMFSGVCGLAVTYINTVS